MYEYVEITSDSIHCVSHMTSLCQNSVGTDNVSHGKWKTRQKYSYCSAVFPANKPNVK